MEGGEKGFEEGREERNAVVEGGIGVGGGDDAIDAEEE